jgi:hypothetical protein
MTPSESETVRDLVARLVSAEHRITALERLVIPAARRSGQLPPEEQAGVVAPAVVTRRAIGGDPIRQLAAEMAEHARQGRNWEQSIDRVTPGLFSAASRQYAETIGRTGTGARSVAGLRSHVMALAAQQEAAA